MCLSDRTVGEPRCGSPDGSIGQIRGPPGPRGGGAVVRKKHFQTTPEGLPPPPHGFFHVTTPCFAIRPPHSYPGSGSHQSKSQEAPFFVFHRTQLSRAMPAILCAQCATTCIARQVVQRLQETRALNATPSALLPVSHVLRAPNAAVGLKCPASPPWRPAYAERASPPCNPLGL